MTPSRVSRAGMPLAARLLCAACAKGERASDCVDVTGTQDRARRGTRRKSGSDGRGVQTSFIVTLFSTAMRRRSAFDRAPSFRFKRMQLLATVL